MAALPYAYIGHVSRFLWNKKTVTPLSVNVIKRYILLRPNQTKYRKSHKNIRAILPIAPKSVPKPSLKFGSYGIYALKSVRLNASQIEATRLTIVKTIGRKGLKLWIRVFPHIPVTKKPLEVRMGKGKGGVDHFIANVKAGKLLFEYNCTDTNLAKKGYKAACFKLPMRVGFIQESLEQKTLDGAL